MRRDLVLHLIMTLEGGFLGTYAVVSHAGIFASAQTGNLMSMAISLTGRDLADFWVRLGAFGVFSASIALFHILEICERFPLKKWCIYIDMAALLLTMCLPEDWNPVLSLYPIFFASCFQWGAYSSVKGYGCSSLFITNNLKQSVLGWTDYLFRHDRKSLEQAVLYTAVLCMFFVGGMIGCFSAHLWGNAGGIVGFLFLVIAQMILWIG